MKKITTIFIFLIVTTSTAIAQVPTYFNTNVAGGANTFPLANATTSRKVQWFIPANSLGSVPSGNNITDVYFQAGNNASNTYPILTVKMKQTTGTGLTGTASGPVEGGMMVVYTGANVTLNSTTGNWFKITLQTPFLYNPAAPLVVELEHNSTTSIGPYVYQAVNIPGPGNGRQWADYNAATITGVGAQQVNFGIDVIPATPCTAPPSANSTLPASYTTCSGAFNPAITIANTYSFGGITYQWYSSTTSSVGPYVAISGATMGAAPTPTIGVNTWFQVVATCTNPGGGTTTLSPSEFVIAGTTTNSVPYYESFEGIVAANKLPNCSWMPVNLPGTIQTHTSSNTLGRVPRTGTNFASFFYNPAGVNYMYTNGIYLDAGVTYSAGLWYETEYYGYNNWTDLSILYGPTQTTTGLVSIASTNGPAVSNIYKSLSNVFTVPSSGFYYIAVRATAVSGSAQYLTWDDLSITIPCTEDSPNTPTISLSVNSTTICAGDPVNLTVVGADTYTWSTGSNAPTITDFPLGMTTYSVTGTNALTGCMSGKSEIVYVNPVPYVVVLSSPQNVCAGSSANLTALGAAATYMWSNSSTGPNITVNPTTPTTYTVIATGSNGCSATASQLVNVYNLPTVTASTNRPNEMCPTETAILTAGGTAISYQWISNTSSFILSGNPVIVSPNATSIYTVTGTDANGCQKSTTIVQNVTECTGIAEQTVSDDVKVYPNPTTGELFIESNNSLNKNIEVVDVTGKLVLSSTSSLETFKLNVANLSAGIYYIKIQSNNSVEVLKVVKH